MPRYSKSKICLIGFMASGKSLLGKSLALILNQAFIDLDQYIEEQEKLSIREIFSAKGENYFRILEEKYLKEVLNSDSNAVIALGGGTPLNPVNLDLIKQKSLSLYLAVSLNELIARLKRDSGERPLLQANSSDEMVELISDLFASREGTYVQADMKIDAEDLSADVWKGLLPEIQAYLK